MKIFHRNPPYLCTTFMKELLLKTEKKRAADIDDSYSV